MLPFANIAGDEATGRLTDGLTEDIITDLSRYRNMDVTSHNSTERYKGKAVDVRQVGKELNVRYVLEGSVQRDGDQLRVTAQLIDAASDAHLWSERWDKPSKDFFAVQSDIASQLGNRLGEAGVIDKAEQEAARRSRPDNFSAYELYLLGRSEALRMSADGNAKALELFEKAVAADPRLARAWADLAYTRQNSTNYGGDPGTVGAKALAEARRAVEIDPSDAGAHATLGYVLAMRGDFGPSEAEFDTALRLNPGDADILAEYSGWASTFGHPEHGAEAADHAIRLNPNYQVWQGFQFSWAYFSVGRIRGCAAHPGAAAEREIPTLRLGHARRELRRAWPRAASKGDGRRHACEESRPDNRGLFGSPGLERCRSSPVHRANAGRRVPTMRETGDSGEKPTIGAPARVRVEMNSARRFWRNEAFFALSVK